MVGLRLAAVVFALVATAAPAPAAEPADPVAVRRAPGSIRVDGELGDAGWQGAAAIDRFWETRPGDNTEARVRTVVLVTYDEGHLYLGIRCDDPDPARIRAPFVERDGVVGTDDNVAVFLDTRNDGRSAVELRVSPRGQQADASFNDPTQSEDFSPDLFYTSAARITATGWTAELRVPFSSLRYPKQDAQTWRILVWRNYPREHRYALHSRPIPRGSDCLICHAQPLTGLVGLPTGGGLVVAPYATAQDVAAAATPGAPLGAPDRHAEAGLDLKWRPFAGSALDATVNPDFSQVESDVAQIAVNNRFALFYPEKRPFFMEGVDLFETPIQAVYTRTITAPRWGARATGKWGRSAYTVLAAEDDGGGSVLLPGPTGSSFAPQETGSFVGVARFRRDLGASYAGALVTARQLDGGGFNRVFGPDAQWRVTARDQVAAQLLWSDGETVRRPDLAAEWDGRRLSGHAAEASWNHQQRELNWRLLYQDIADGFRADTGFVPRVGYRQLRLDGGASFYPDGLLTQVDPQLVASYHEDRDGHVLQRVVQPGVFLAGRRNLQALASLRLASELTAGRLLSTRSFRLLAQVDPSRRFTRVGVEAAAGESIDLANGQVGTGADLSLYATLRPAARVTLDLLAARRWLDVPLAGGGRGRLFTADVYRARALVHLSARAYLRLIAQWVGTTSDPLLYPFEVKPEDGSLQGSLLFTYRLDWQTALYLGYGDDRATDAGRDLRRASRQLFVKLSYAWQH